MVDDLKKLINHVITQLQKSLRRKRDKSKSKNDSWIQIRRLHAGAATYKPICYWQFSLMSSSHVLSNSHTQIKLTHILPELQVL